MILDSPALVSLPVGIDRVIPQDGDSQVVIPSIISATLEPIGPLNRFLAPNLLTPQNASFLTESNFTRTNQVAATSLLAMLARGLWELFISMTVRFNYTGITGPADVGLTLRNEADTQSQFFWGCYADNLSSQFEVRRRLLIADTTRVALRFEANGVGQTMTVQACLWGNRLL